MTEKLKMSATISAKPEEIYESWLDSKKHSEMTGSEAKVQPRINGRFTAWDGYIEGKTVEMDPGRRIVQKWRTTDFPSGSPDSNVEIILEEVEKGTKIVLIHTEIPEGQKDDYKQGWKDFYFDPMKDYFM
jgi:activator of HSP90 ATPase